MMIIPLITEGEALQVVHNALNVLEEVARRQPVSLAELHRVLELPKTTVHRALGTLAEAGWIRPAPGRRWAIAPRAVVLGSHAASEGGLRELALPVMQVLRDTTAEAIHLTVRDGDAVVLIERIDSPHAVRTWNPLGTRAPLHASANGKAIWAHLPDADREALFDVDFSAYTDRTETDPERLRDQLRVAARRGWASNRGEFVTSVAAVAAPIFDRSGMPVASIGVSAPVTRLPASAMPRVARFVVAAADELSTLLGHVRGAGSPSPLRELT